VDLSRVNVYATIVAFFRVSSDWLASARSSHSGEEAGDLHQTSLATDVSIGVPEFADAQQMPAGGAESSRQTVGDSLLAWVPSCRVLEASVANDTEY
jgi:hypothetical protein